MKKTILFLGLIAFLLFGTFFLSTIIKAQTDPAQQESIKNNAEISYTDSSGDKKITSNEVSTIITKILEETDTIIQNIATFTFKDQTGVDKQISSNTSEVQITSIPDQPNDPPSEPNIPDEPNIPEEPNIPVVPNVQEEPNTPVIPNTLEDPINNPSEPIINQDNPTNTPENKPKTSNNTATTDTSIPQDQVKKSEEKPEQKTSIKQIAQNPTNQNTKKDIKGEQNSILNQVIRNWPFSITGLIILFFIGLIIFKLKSSSKI